MQQWVDNLCIYDPDFKSVGERLTEESASANQSSAARPAKSIEDLNLIFSQFVHVKYLEFALHGLPGLLFTGNTGITGAGVVQQCHNPHLMANNGRILFHSCEIGKGEAGDKFMEAIAAGLLNGKGGTVGATTVANVVVLPTGGSFMKPLSFGRLKVRQFDSSGAQSGAMDVDRHGFKR